LGERLEELAQRDLAGGSDLVAAEDRDRCRGVEVLTANARTGDDDFFGRALLGCLGGGGGGCFRRRGRGGRLRRCCRRRLGGCHSGGRNRRGECVLQGPIPQVHGLLL